MQLELVRLRQTYSLAMKGTQSLEGWAAKRNAAPGANICDVGSTAPFLFLHIRGLASVQQAVDAGRKTINHVDAPCQAPS